MSLLPQGLREKPQERGTLGSSDWHGVLSQRTRAPARRKGRSVGHFPEKMEGRGGEQPLSVWRIMRGTLRERKDLCYT